MALTSEITAYNEDWPRQFAREQPRLAVAFGRECRAIHHVGSTAVPGLAAKPEIDVLIVVVQHCNLDHRDRVLSALGYVRG